MKVALASDDGRNISAHFGRAEYYVVIEIVDGEVVSRRLVPKENHQSLLYTKLIHSHALDEDCSESCTEEQHRRMFAPVRDCEVVVARRMGSRALRILQELGLKPILTDLADVDSALRDYLSGTLLHHPDHVH